MINEDSKQCKSKGCCIPVFDGKYCEFCKKRRKENKDNCLKKVVGGVGILGSGVAIKHVPKIAAEAIHVILRRKR